MTPIVEEISAVVAENGLPPGAADQLHAFLRALAEDPTAPTTVTDPHAALNAHVADALDALDVPGVREAAVLADIGSGAGIPGLPLAIALPRTRVNLVESVGKKCQFIARTAERAGIENVAVVNARAEAWHDGLGANDVVTARALAPLGVLVEYAAPLLRDGGILVAWKGSLDAAELDQAAAAGEAVGMGFIEAGKQPVRAGADTRALHVYRKVRPTPERFPRRPGMARKRPITGRSG